MARLAVFVPPAHGHINPLVPIVRELVRLGHDVTCHVDPDFRDKLLTTGVRLVSGRPPVVIDPQNPDLNLTRLSTLLMEATEVLLPRYLDHHREPPDLVIHDSLAPWGRYLAQVQRVPAVCSTSTFAFDLRVVRSGGISGDVARMARDALPALARYAACVHRLSSRYPIHGFTPLDVFTNAEPLTLVYTSRELQPLGETFDLRYRFVGPSLPEPGPLDIPTRRPLVYVSLGTLLNDRTDIYRACIEALADKNVVLSIGQRTDPASLGPVPDHFVVRPSVPQVALLARTDLFVTHGGMNSVHEGLVHGIPLVLFPQTPEQSLVARRVEALGAGVALDEIPSPRTLRALCLDLLAPGTHRRRAADLARGLMRAGGWKRAVREIVAFMQRRDIA